MDTGDRNSDWGVHGDQASGTQLPPFATVPPGPARFGYRNDPEYVAYLERRIAALEARIPDSKVISPKFWTRAFAVYGHSIAASLVIAIPVYLIYFILIAVFIGVAAINGSGN